MIKDKKKLDVGFLNIAIPQNLENLQLPSPELLTFYKNYKDRILWIDDEINRLTGIRNEDVINAPMFAEAFASFLSWLPWRRHEFHSQHLDFHSLLLQVRFELFWQH